MPEEKLELAKEIFWRYNGLFFHMDREGEYEKYKAFNISKNQERAWREERRDELFEKLSIEKNKRVLSSLFRGIADIVKVLEDKVGLQKMLLFLNENNEQFDTFVVLLLAETVVHTTIAFNNSEQLKKSVLKSCLRILENTLKKTFSISMDYEGAFYEPMTEEKVRNRIEVLIRQCR